MGLMEFPFSSNFANGKDPNGPRDSHDHGFGEADPFSLPRLMGGNQPSLGMRKATIEQPF